MPIPIAEDTIKLVWENNPDTPITSSTLSKTIDYVSSYRDFEFVSPAPNSQGTILMKDPSATSIDRLIMKREVSIGLINLETRIPINQQYKVFDNGLEDLYIRIQDIDNSLANPIPVGGTWGENKEWFVYLCDAEDYPTGQLLVSLSNVSPQNTQILGNPSYYYTANNVRMIGGFKTDGSANIIESSVWDIAGKDKYTKAKQYFIIDEFGQDDLNEDPQGRHIYRPLRSSDLDTTYVAGNTFQNDIVVKGNLRVDNQGDDTTRIELDSENNSIIINGIEINSDSTNLNLNSNVIVRDNLVFVGDKYNYDYKFEKVLGEAGIAFRVDGSIAAGESIFSVRSIGQSERLRVEHDGRIYSSNNILDLNGAVLTKGNTVPSGVTALGYDGYFYATRVYNAVYNDLAEYFKSISELKAGKVYTLNSNSLVKISDKRADKKVIGVCSDTPAFVMKEEYAKNGGVPIALAGTVKVFVHSKVNEGDELVSDRNGYSVKANLFERLFKRSSILGKALESSKDNDDKRILMLVK